jgi:predicted DNA-binding transcriptional regulator AlpA
VETETVLLKIPEVLERLAISQTKLYELMSSGELRSVKVPARNLCRGLSG